MNFNVTVVRQIKTTLIVFAIIALLSVKQQPAIVPCNNKVIVVYYLNGKRVYTFITAKGYNSLGGNEQFNKPKDEGGTFIADSITFEMYAPKVKTKWTR